MNWRLTGTDAQIAIIQNALDKIKFPFERLTLPGKPELGWRDLNTPRALKADGGHHEEQHDDHHDESGEPHLIEGTLEGRYYVLGVFYPGNGSIYLDNKLVNYKDMAEATVSAEIAHAVDEFLPLTEEQRNAIILLLNDGRAGENTWWEKVDYSKEYFTLAGEAFMILFTKAYSEIPFGNTSAFEDQGQNITPEQIRAIVGVERTDKPDINKILAWKKRARALVQRLVEDMAEIDYLLKNKPQ